MIVLFFIFFFSPGCWNLELNRKDLLFSLFKGKNILKAILSSSFCSVIIKNHVGWFHFSTKLAFNVPKLQADKIFICQCKHNNFIALYWIFGALELGKKLRFASSKLFYPPSEKLETGMPADIYLSKLPFWRKVCVF